MKIIKLFLFLTIISCQSKRNNYLSILSEKQMVYICISPDSHRYHFDSTCFGFNRCTHERKKVTIKEAKEMGYSECRIEG